MPPNKQPNYKESRPHEEEPPLKRRKTSQAMSTTGFSCFTLDGNDIKLHRRSAFSAKRKAEVKGIRRKGACLRCRLLKRACSGQDPCKTCIAAARAAASSKALMWMECIRPSFQAINIFSESITTVDQSRIDDIVNHLSTDDVYLDFHIPFALNVEAASSHLARWLSADDSSPSFSVVGVFSCSSNTNLLQNALDPTLARYLRLFVHLTTHLYTTGMQGGYDDYTDEEIRSVRDCVGDRLLRALDPLVRPTEIEASEDKLAKLRSLFLLLLGTIVGMRYTCSDVFDQTVSQWGEQEAKQEALLRLLCHYLIYIGKVTALLESSSEEKTLLDQWRTQWNKPAAFTWNCNQGLEMHYRIEPPANWIVSSSEDESLSSIDNDLSEFDDIAMFTEDGDLVKCASCGTWWTELDWAGLCLICQSPEYQDEGFTQLVSFESDVSFPADQVIDIGSPVGLHVPTDSFDLSLSEDKACREGDSMIVTAHDPTLTSLTTENYLLGIGPSAPITSTNSKGLGELGSQSSLLAGANLPNTNVYQNTGKTQESISAHQSVLSSSQRRATSQHSYICASAIHRGRDKCEFQDAMPEDFMLPMLPPITKLPPNSYSGATVPFSRSISSTIIRSSTQSYNINNDADTPRDMATVRDIRMHTACWRCSPHANTKNGTDYVCERCQRATGNGYEDVFQMPSNSPVEVRKHERLLI